MQSEGYHAKNKHPLVAEVTGVVGARNFLRWFPPQGKCRKDNAEPRLEQNLAFTKLETQQIDSPISGRILTSVRSTC